MRFSVPGLVRRSTRLLPALGFAACLPFLPGIDLASEPSASIAIAVHSRESAPGEPVRILVRTEEPLADLSGRFLDEPVAFLRLDRSTWTGWSMIPLEREPGAGAVELTGRTAGGKPVAATRAVTIREKPFPVEKLTVSSRYVEPPREVKERLAKERARLKKIYLRREPLALPSKPFVRPVSGEPTSVFGTRRLFNGKPRSPHPGLDLRAASGTPVAASGDGIVVLAQDLYYSGNTVILDHGGGLFTLYAHLSRIDVKEDASVKAGDILGLSGATGRVTGPHLHWGAKIGNRPFDPTALLDPALFEE